MQGVLGVVVAGGEGRRLGLDGPKALAMLEGRTLVDRAIGVLRALGAEVLVALSPERPFELPPESDADVVWDAPGAAGPLAGVVAGLAARPFRVAFVLGVDFPLVRPETFVRLVARLRSAAAVVPAPGGRLQPLVAAYAPASLAALARSLGRGERSLVAAVTALEPHRLDDKAIAALEGGARNLFNVNTPQDLEEAGRLLRAAETRSGA